MKFPANGSDLSELFLHGVLLVSCTFRPLQVEPILREERNFENTVEVGDTGLKGEVEKGGGRGEGSRGPLMSGAGPATAEVMEQHSGAKAGLPGGAKTSCRPGVGMPDRAPPPTEHSTMEIQRRQEARSRGMGPVRLNGGGGEI